uniref:G-type lectin S-receptor-like serine/threonine-protein kinase At4g27290 n=1 Tax=Fragaria vesca subsp. vesca TaxID=101020 RepID=UPI0005C9BB47|nr:PREDICTED: G-type lectin S-receptor-like serine/threonine-protein kinase At4g27290 [Fragaria vesca subsp. vesca]
METRSIPIKLMISFFFSCLYLSTSISLAADSITTIQSLSGDQTIVSAGGVFQLGFFTPGTASNFYIGMWYTQVSERTIVWVANREQPVFDIFSSVLKISDGNLVLYDESNTPIWSTNVASNITLGTSIQAVLLDDGNFVLRPESGSSHPLWQSFDHPSHTFLPGSKLGFNRVTKQSQMLISWKNSEDPSPGQFSLEVDPTSNSYFGWLNRESPLHSPGVCMLSGDGNLVVLDETRNVIWSTNASSVSASAMSNTTALLLDTGNLVLRFGNQTLWESFNYPTDTVLPGMKIGFNKRTGQQWLVTSWAASDDPQPGKFTSGIDPKVPWQLLAWKENVPYWRSAIYGDNGDTTLYRGPGGEFFSIDDRSFFYLAYTNHDDEAFFTVGASDKSVKLITVLKASGMLLLQLWKEDKETWISTWGEPLHTCEYIARCGPNGACDKYESVSPCKCLTGFTPKIQEQWDVGNWEGGCIREKNLTCDDHDEGFTKFEKLKLPDHSIMLYKGSISECESECLWNCSCTVYAYMNVSQFSPGRCFKWFGDLMDLVENHTHGKDLYIRVRQHHSYQVDNFFKGPLVIALISSAAGLLSILFGCFLWKKTLGKEGSFGGSKNITIGHFSTRGEKSDTELPLFDLRCVLAATNNFSEGNKLGEGGFGPVYKGIFPENQEVAIKRLSKKSGQGHQEFLNEIKLIAKLQHNNLVRLLGCCVEEEEMILIYEFMPNRSLDKFLFDPSEQSKLDWDKRFRIIEGIAQGVLYIHKYSRLKIIHQDLKASNVLLDEEMNPKVSDFGMARIFGVNQTEANTNRVVGT